MHERIVGQSPWRVDGIAKVTGKAVFPQDIYLPGMVYGKTVRSKYPHAKITKLDTSKAEALPGVLKVFTARDVPGHNGHGVLHPDIPVFADGKVTSINDAICLVVAETQDIAEEAALLIDVEYEELPAVFDPREAMKETAPKLRENGNIAYHLKIRKGDVEKGFALADVIVEQSFKTSMVDQAFLQPEAGVATVDERGHIVIYVATQYPHWDRTEIARALGVSQNMVRVVTTAVGGAFGGREDMTVQIHACLAAMVLKRPVKIVYDRSESFKAHSKRHPMYMDYRVGATRDGKLVALEATIIGDAGAYLSWSPNILRKAAVHATGPYYIPNVKVDSYAVHTNNPFTGAMRGFGAAQPPMAYEAIMDMLAEKLNLHPFTIRWRNAFERGSETATGQILDMSVGLKETMLEAARRFGWNVEELK
ncbi:aldehyde oxidase [Carboxydothermus islandicus]|uniref:Aldehyde oxidase n=1 Tax=Carboxydothermus islandicus TaxID=661089 RepID=A0A1L8D5M5_9THEO|nr:molybdopterin cofactor-binding domain-containing protein [Carboxydothermus islandicus]GAV26506.1 aldehyde oxidase [Carboxydothermus islandicus]